MTAGRFDRNIALYGKKYTAPLSKTVAIFGLGGVGGYVLEGLARYGIANFVLVDADDICITNINRQILATSSTIGRSKVEVARERLLEINPDAQARTHKTFVLSGKEVSLDGVDFVVDAIDTVTAKLALIKEATERGIGVISTMGCGTRFDPQRLRIERIERTSGCPLCRVMRRELRQLGLQGITVLYSTESAANVTIEEQNGRHIPASAPFVPAVAGLLIANEVIRQLQGDI